MGSPAAPSPYQYVEQTTKLAPKYEALLGFNKDAAEYSPFQALSRQAGAQAKMIEGMTTRPTWSSMYAAMGVPQGQDLTPYIQAMRQGTSMPMAPIPQSPEAGTIPEFTPPSDTGKAPKKKAEGGLMSLRKYAPGGNVKSLTQTQRQAVLRINKAIEAGTATDAQKARLDKIEKNTGLNVSPFSDTGTGVPKNPTVAKSVTSAAKTYTQQEADKAPAPPVPYSQAMTVQTPFFAGEEAARADRQYGGITNPIYQQALDQLRAASVAPETIGQGAGIMSQAAGRLMDQAGYTPQQIAAQRADVTGYDLAMAQAAGYDPAMAQAAGYQATSMAAPKDIAAQGYDAAQMQAASMKAAQAKRSDIRDIEAQMAQVEKMRAEMMQAPTEANVKDYEAAQARLYQMQGPKSWTEAGTAQQYMSPYMQNVVDIQKRESMRDYAKQLNQLKSQAVGAKAYGGSRLAIEQAEAARNQAQRLGDIEAQGLQQAYQQGMGQFSAEQGMNLQANQANLQAAQQTTLANQAATNQQRQNYVNSALQAAMQAYGGQLTTAQQNQIAANAASQFNAQSQNQAYNNYVAQQLAAQQANQGMDWNTVNLNTSNQQAAALANAQFQQQAAQANQNAINQQRSQFVTQQLEAAKVNYGGQLTAAQQNQIAANAAGQFNAANQQQINLANQASQNVAGQFNAANQQQINLANQASQNVAGQFLAGAQNQAGMQYAANQLTAATQNQQAGLTGQGLSLQALNQAGQMGQGIGGLGVSTWNQQQNLPQLWGAAGQTVQGIAQQAATGAQQTAQNWWGGMANAYQPTTNLILGAAGQQGTKQVSQTPGT